MSPFGVPGRTRTVDIQNHKQSLECLINPVFIGVSAIYAFKKGHGEFSEMGVLASF